MVGGQAYLAKIMAHPGLNPLIKQDTMAHPDLDKLLNALLPFAQQSLAKYGEFYPFGSSMMADGQVNANAASTGEEHPSSQELIELLTTIFREQAETGQIRAAGICRDMLILPPGQAQKTDAICIGLEHKSGEAVEVCLPYKKNTSGQVEYGQLFASRRRSEFFIHQ